MRDNLRHIMRFAGLALLAAAFLVKGTWSMILVAVGAGLFFLAGGGGC
ncbi:MAG: hypothetical protein ACOY81_06920 [Bacillota bacterium]|nr:hypothetical protein [Desulfurispora thermophila]